ncbi:undecaprenyldiphospho-muramoylpentapeptide beta-N-acetylglucosaminyltransferase [Paenibacillus sp. F411]|uniref:undecaprenyldiphospho-muramoylpentapeptide beta-N-acetylglucosaminyltransferase n=1 Tax=Paenibacillus sp. F411 TaxID=2820239 RepID=UPI001AAE841A|nr:undecaprenyldiphospho-muramoylpentapeptide beta-N-acetylglucosaminyltransferase [Paenibacillus sp. F411]MBO2943204.1 undecaprenyldiphospho-muramoylpentapeptide beta-N-acetylglucosaminyltransferase [Paenibacillus sp. F411]
MRVVLTGGGTGGHIYPAVAIARQCEAESANNAFLYIGSEKGLEARLVPQEGLPFESIDITGFRRKLSMDNVKTIMRFFKGVTRSKKLLTEFKPDVVIGTGGYVCGPVVYAAAKLGIPTMIHEQNAIPGLTNQFLSRYADTVAVSFKGSEGAFRKGKRVVYTGNPRATSVQSANRERGFASLGIPMNSKVVLITGGSRGANVINQAMIGMASRLEQLEDVHFVYVTGDIYFEKTREAVLQMLGTMPNRLHIVPYINNMPEVLAAASLIVNRAGASFLAEITSLGIPSILIPSPNVTNNHQEANARELEEAGACRMILEKELTEERLWKDITDIVQDPALQASMSRESKRLGKPDSAAVILKEIHRLTTRM